MLLLVAVLLGAVAAGSLRGGRLRSLARLELRSPGLVLAAVLTQLAGALAGSVAYVAGLAGSALLAAAFLARNRSLRGTGLVALGLLANALVVAVNGAMPVSARAAALAGADVTAVAAGGDGRHELLGPQTRLRVLADVLPVPLPPTPSVASAGDVLVAAGLARLVVTAMCGSAGGVRPGWARWSPGSLVWSPTHDRGRHSMAKRGRKRRGRKKNAANHGKRPNA